MIKYLTLMGAFFTSSLFGQTKSGDWSLGLTSDYVNFEGFSPKYAVGVTGEFMLGKRLGVESSIAAGKDYFHVGTGIIFVPLGLLLSKADSENGFLVLLLTAAALFEHTNYHIPISSNFEVIPFVSLLRIRYLYDEGHPYNQDIFPSWSVGAKLSFVTKNNWYVNATVEGGQFYYPDLPKGIQSGLNIGYIFRSQNQ